MVKKGRIFGIFGIFVFLGCSPKNETLSIYLARHGQTLMNMTGVVQGWADSPLTPLGIDSAKKLGEALKNLSFDAVYTSTSRRAVDTAKYVLFYQDHPIRIIEEKDDLREVFYGAFDGTYSEHSAIENYFDYYTEPYGFSKVGGESHPQAVERFTKVIGEIILENQSGGNILVIAHGMIISDYLKSIDLEQMEPYMNKALPNSSVNLLKWKDGGMTVEYIAKTVEDLLKESL